MKKTVIIGNLGQDAQVKTTQGGQQFLGFTVAVSEKRSGQEFTTWFSCSAWGNFVTGAIGQYLKKGTKVYLEGNYNPTLYNAQDGSVQISHNLMVNQIELLGSAPQTQGQQPVAQAAQQAVQQPAQGFNASAPATFYNPTAQPAQAQPVYHTPGSGHKDDIANAGFGSVNPDDVPF